MKFSLGSLGGSIYLNGYFSGATAVGSYFLVGPLTEWIGRRKALVVSYSVGGVGFLLYYSF